MNQHQGGSKQKGQKMLCWNTSVPNVANLVYMLAWCYWRWLGFMSRGKREKLDKTWRTFGIPMEDWRFESLPM